MTGDGGASGATGTTGATRPRVGPVWRSLRAQLALLGFAAIYVPVLVLFGVTSATEVETTSTGDGVDVTTETTPERSPWVAVTALALGPAAAGLAWWWAGRAVRPLDRVRRVAEEIEATDPGRRIGLDHGPVEVVALAAGFDAMLDRLEWAADTQRRLIEETSHELRTPLAVLAINAEVALAQPDPTVDSLRQGMERSQAAVARLQATIEQLLVEARGRARTLARRPTDLVAILRGLVEEARPLAAAKGVELALTAPAAVVCPLDERTVRRAVLNLVDNAVRHAPAGSTVEVTAERDGPEARVVVADHGPGIPADQQERIFERFWRGGTGAPDAPGTGLGLHVASQVARAHGGALTVTSPGPAGDGAVFTLTVRP